MVTACTKASRYNNLKDNFRALTSEGLGVGKSRLCSAF